VDTTFDTALPASSGSRRARFRESVGQLAERSTSSDLIRWMLIPGSVAVVLGFVLMGLGWYGASHTAREIEQIPYLISGGLLGLGLVVVGGLLLASTFWVAVTRKLLDETRQ
jgi:peptidoglycan biosynthesis protein MviN/MurJ (putative lipid II flippase)